DTAAGRLHPVDSDGDWITDPDRTAASGPDQHGLGRVELVALAAADPAGRQESLIDVRECAAEANEGTGPDHARDLPLEAGVRAALEQLALEQERGADRVCVALGTGRVTLALRTVCGQLGETFGTR